MTRHSTKLWIRHGTLPASVLLLAGTGAVISAQGPMPVRAMERRTRDGVEDGAGGAPGRAWAIGQRGGPV